MAFASLGGKALTPEEEFRVLRQELEKTKRERDILKTNYKRSNGHFRLRGWNCQFFRKHRIERLIS